VVLANLDPRIAERETKTLRGMLTEGTWAFEQDVASDGRGPGNVVMLEVEGEHATEVFTGFGRLGVRAEAVARAPVAEMREWLAADVPVGVHLADQLLLPMALAGAGRFRTLPPTPHASTNLDVIRLFLPSSTPSIANEGGVSIVALDVRSTAFDPGVDAHDPSRGCASPPTEPPLH
jgi:RNA 3'-terminal phosphate cyclase (ATP)